MTDFSKQLDIIAEKAEKLRKAGVLNVTVGDMSFVLAPMESALPDGLQKLLDEQNNETQGETHNPLDDASTYGLPPGTALPGFARLINDRTRE